MAQVNNLNIDSWANVLLHNHRGGKLFRKHNRSSGYYYNFTLLSMVIRVYQIDS
jgi:hypothetical protein